MRKNYETPQIEVIEIQIEDAILNASQTEKGTESARVGLTLGN